MRGGALLGWIAILLPLVHGLMLVGAALLLARLADLRWFDGHAWYLQLRKRLTLVATLSLVITAVSVLMEV